MAREAEVIQAAVAELLRINRLLEYRVVRVRRSRKLALPGRRPLPCLNPFDGKIPPHRIGRDRWVVTVEVIPAASAFRAYVCRPCADAILEQRSRWAARPEAGDRPRKGA